MDPRRDHVPFDPRFFEKQDPARRATTQAVFEDIHRRHHWQGSASVSGAGADRTQTAQIEAVLPDLLRDLGAAVLLDLPCGDFSWMQHVDLDGIRYVGADIVPALIAQNAERHASPTRRFVHLDLLRDPLPPADLLLCRDLLVHFAFADIFAAFAAIRASGVPYVLTTTFPDCPANEDITTGDWRPLNLECAPFHLPPPLRLVQEGCTEGDGRFAAKSLGLWLAAVLPA